jgi:hypothetical protein
MMDDLAERVEAAMGPDRELDFAIYQMLNPPKAANAEPIKPKHRYLYVEPYTASLDAAMTLVPEGASIDLRTGQTFSGAIAMMHPTRMRPTITCRAATPALALCAAALRARDEGGKS